MAARQPEYRNSECANRAHAVIQCGGQVCVEVVVNSEGFAIGAGTKFCPISVIGKSGDPICFFRFSLRTVRCISCSEQGDDR